jgi:hypothetical protein
MKLYHIFSKLVIY